MTKKQTDKHDVQTKSRAIAEHDTKPAPQNAADSTDPNASNTKDGAESATQRPAAEAGATLPVSEKLISSSGPAGDARLLDNATDAAERPETGEERIRQLVAKAQARGLLVEPGEVQTVLDEGDVPDEGAYQELVDKARDAKKLIDPGQLARILAKTDAHLSV